MIEHMRRKIVVGKVRANYSFEMDSDPGMDGATYSYSISAGDKLDLVRFCTGREAVVVGIQPAGGSNLYAEYSSELFSKL